MTPAVTLIDYGAGNVTSVERALHKLGAETTRANTSQQIDSATTLILPGVGHFVELESPAQLAAEIRRALGSFAEGAL